MNMKLLNASQVADILGVSLSFTYKLMATGLLRTVKMGKSRRVDEQDLKKFIDQRKTNEDERNKGEVQYG